MLGIVVERAKFDSSGRLMALTCATNASERLSPGTLDVRPYSNSNGFAINMLNVIDNGASNGSIVVRNVCNRSHQNVETTNSLISSFVY